MNALNLNVQALTSREMEETNGGITDFAVVWALIQTIEEAKAAMEEVKKDFEFYCQ